MSEAEDNVEEVIVPRRSTRQRTVKKLDDDYEYEAPAKKKTTPKKNPATKRKASTEEEQEDVKPSSTILLSSPPPKPVETKKTKKRKTKKEKEEEQRESLKMREKMHKEMQEAKEMEKRNMEEMIKRENEKKLLEEEAKKKEEEETKSSAASASSSTTITTTKKVKKKKSKKVVEQQKVDMSDDSSSSEEEDISRGFSDLQRVVNLSTNGLEKPVLIHGGFIKVLKPHQLEGVRFCWKHISLGRGCVLAHSMGLGKTLQMITLAHTLLISSNYKTRRFLIVCPKSVILNWDAEFRKWLDQCVNKGISIRTIKDKDKTNESRLFKLEKWKNKGGVLILSFQMFHRFLGHYNKEKDIMSLNMQKNELQQYKVQRDTRKRLGVSTIDLEATIKDLAEQIEKTETRYQQRDEFEQKASDIIINSTQLVIVDEAHRMCSNTDIFINQALNRLDTQYRIALTGTPIQNNLMEYYAMINWVRKGYWTNEEFFAFFSKPIQSGMRKDSDDKAVEEMKKSSFLLVKELEEFIHRRDQSVLRDSLPPKHEYVISFRVNPLQARLYKAFADARQKEERKFGSASGSGLFDPKFYSQPLTREQVDKSSKTLFYLSVLLNKITNHPDLVRLYCERREFTFEDCLKHPGVFITREEMQEKRHLKELEEEEGMEDDEEPETPPKIKKSESPIKTTSSSSVKYEPLKRESTPSSSSVKNEPISLDDDDEDLFSMDLLSSISSQPKTPASSTTKKESPFADKKVQPKKEESPPPKTKKSSAKKSKAKKEENNDTPKSKKNKIVSSLDEEDNLEEEFEAAEEVMGNNLFWAAPVLSQEYKLFNARNSPKMEFLLRLIEKCYLNNEKILIFTQYVEMLDVMEGVFKNTPIVVGTEEDDDGNLVPIKKNLAKGDDYFRLDGSISGQKRQDLVDNFTPESTAHVFIISTKAGGLGINLVAATRVVIFDPCWNDTWDKQALFRAYRYGQTKPVYVYRFVTYGSAEEKIFNLSTAKAWLAKRIVDDKTPDLIMKKGDLEILNQALSIEETMRDKLLLNPKQYQEDSFLNDLLGVNWEYSEEVIDPLKPVHHIVIDEEEEKPEEKVKKPDTFYPEEEEDPSGEFNVQRKIKSVFRYDSLFVENEKLRLEESEQERSINEYEQKRKEVRENPGKLLAEIMSDDLYDPSVLISPSSLVPPTMGSLPPDSPLTPMIDSTRLALLARLQQFIQSQDNNQEANDVDREASTTLNSMWQKVSANEDVMKMINKIRKRRQRTLASQGLSSSPANTPTTPSQPPSSFTFDALQNNYHSSPTQQQAFSFTNPTQASQGFSMMPPPSSSSVASASSPRTSMFSIPVVSLDEPVEIQPRPASTTKRTNVFTNSISLDSDDDE